MCGGCELGAPHDLSSARWARCRKRGCEDLPGTSKSSGDRDWTLLALFSPFIYSSYLMLISGPFASDLRLKKDFF